MKIAVEQHYVMAVFGWDDALQRQLHREEWVQVKPNIIEVEGKPMGTFYLQEWPDHWYLGQLFIHPDFQNQGVGSAILKQVLATCKANLKPCRLKYLQGNPVGTLYERFGFEQTQADEQFIYMEYRP